jgi:hypothetical protein
VVNIDLDWICRKTLSVWNFCYSNNDDFEEITGRKWKRKLLSVWQYINKLSETWVLNSVHILMLFFNTNMQTNVKK